MDYSLNFKTLNTAKLRLSRATQEIEALDNAVDRHHVLIPMGQGDDIVGNSTGHVRIGGVGYGGIQYSDTRVVFLVPDPDGCFKGTEGQLTVAEIINSTIIHITLNHGRYKVIPGAKVTGRVQPLGDKEYLLIRISGELTGKTENEMKDQLTKLIKGFDRVVADYSGVEYMSSVGIRLTLTMKELCKVFAVVSPSQVVLTVFDSIALQKQIKCFADIKAAEVYL